MTAAAPSAESRLLSRAQLRLRMKTSLSNEELAFIASRLARLREELLHLRARLSYSEWTAQVCASYAAVRKVLCPSDVRRPTIRYASIVGIV